MMKQEQFELDHQNFKDGFRLSEKEADHLNSLSTHDSIAQRAIRIRLLGYYSRSTNVDGSGLWFQQLSWLINNCPEDMILGEKGIPDICSQRHLNETVELWLTSIRLHPENDLIAENAATCLAGRKPEIAKELFSKLFLKSSTDERLAIKLATVSLTLASASPSLSDASILDQCENLCSLVSHRGDQFLLFDRMCGIALRSREFARAVKYADRMYVIAEEMGVFQDWALSWLGRISLANNDLTSATEYLKELQSHGFSRKMSLPNDLLLSGQRNLVVDYLLSLSPDSPKMQNQISKWIASIKDGQSPILVDLKPSRNN